MGLEPAERSARLREAIRLWRGDPLAEVAFEPFAVSEARRLEELRLSALEQLFDAELAAGRSGDLVPELESLVARHPLRERFRGELMLALYGAGRQAQALAAYQEARRMLVEELGLEPGPAPAGAPRADPSTGGAAAAARARRDRRGPIPRCRRRTPRRPARPRARSRARRACCADHASLRLSERRASRPDARRAVRRAHEGGRPLVRRASRAARSERRADCYAPLLRVATFDSPRTRGTVRTYACIVCGTLPELQRVVEQRLRG